MMILPIALSPWLMGVFVSESSSQKFRQRADRQARKISKLPVKLVAFTFYVILLDED